MARKPIRRKQGLHPDTDETLYTLAKVNFRGVKNASGGPPEKTWESMRFMIAAGMAVHKFSAKQLAEKMDLLGEGAIPFHSDLSNWAEYMRSCAGMLDTAANRVLAAMSRNVVAGEKAGII